jgi:Leucine-rich repeat (LRR) protein
MDNKLTGETLSALVELKELQSLSLGGNQFSSYDDLKPLQKLEKLYQLDLFNTPLATKTDYRSEIFKLFPKLGILDNLDPNGQEVEYDDDDEDELGEGEGEGEP